MTQRLRAPAEHLMSDEQRQAFDAIVAGPRGKVEGPLGVWLNSPQFALRAQSLGAYCRFCTALPARLSELAILVTGAHWKAGFEWRTHHPLGLQAGLSAEDLECVRTGATCQFSRADEMLVYELVTSMLRSGRVADELYSKAARQLGETELVELVGVVGYYTLICLTINVFNVGDEW